MIYLFVLALTVYVLGVCCLILIWQRITCLKVRPSEVSATVIVPVRNGERTITDTVKSILSNECFDFELIVVNDHSEDETLRQLNTVSSNQLKIVDIPAGEKGKKAAITYGVKLAKGKVVICTDADTLVGESWVKEHVSAFEAGSKLSFGPVSYRKPNYWQQLLDIELTALIGVGAVSAEVGSPGMINGCNYSFSKQAFELVEGFKENEEIPTGDDEFLLRKISTQFPNSIRFIKSHSALVMTDAANSISELINQRRRWASKWKLHKGWSSKLLPLTIMLIYSILLLTPFIVSGEYAKWLIIGWGIKCVFDFIYLKSVSRVTQVKVHLLSVVLLQIIYPFYVVFFGLASNFGEYHWKGRSYKI